METCYDISVLPQGLIHLVTLPVLNDDGEFILIQKRRNNSNCDKYIGYHVASTDDDNNTTHKNFNNFNKEGSLIILSGSVKSYTIQSSVTVRRFQHVDSDSDDFNDFSNKVYFKQAVNATLESVEQSTEIQKFKNLLTT